MQSKLILSFFLLSIISCAPNALVLKDLKPINFDKTESYEVESKLNAITKPDKLQPIYVKIKWTGNKGAIEKVPSVKEATHILLVGKEYSKVGGLVKLAGTYKTIIIDQEKLINSHITTINGLKELIVLEGQKVSHYQELYINSENAFLTERHDHKIDNIINKAALCLVTIGVIAALAL